MNIDEAIKAHSDWRVRLRSYMRGHSQEKLDAGTVARDNVCALGKWLYGDGRRFQSNELFTQLVKEHADFHRAASRIVLHVDRKQLAEAEQELDGTDSAYTRSSRHVTMLLMKLKGIL